MHSRIYYLQDEKYRPDEVEDADSLFPDGCEWADYFDDEHADYAKDMDWFSSFNSGIVLDWDAGVNKYYIKVTQELMDKLFSYAKDMAVDIIEKAKSMKDCSNFEDIKQVLWEIASCAENRYGFRYYAEGYGFMNTLSFYTYLEAHVGKRIYFATTIDYHY